VRQDAVDPHLVTAGGKPFQLVMFLESVSHDVFAVFCFVCHRFLL
jgi:hypothetical protein